jgi:hypothetical protein
LFFAQVVQDLNPPILCFPHLPSCQAFFCWDGVSQTFLLRLAWNHDPPNLNLPCSLGWQVNTTVSSYCLRYGFLNSLPGLALHYNLLHLSLPCSFDYRCEPPVPSSELSSKV